MFKQESVWIASFIHTKNPSEISPLLNIGSSTYDFRTRVQPWIDENLFAPARRAGTQIIHMDLKDGPGVDVAGDLTDISLQSQLRSMNFQAVLCSNLLEHVTDRLEICGAIENLLTPGKYIILTCPHQYPYHPDPIDTLFRPTPAELAALFPRSTVVLSSILDCGTYLDRLLQNPKYLIWNFLRLALPIYKPYYWRQLWELQFWMFRTFKVSCVILQRNSQYHTHK